MDRNFLKHVQAQNRENRMHGRFDLQLPAYNEQYSVYSDDDPDLYFDCVFVMTEERLDAHMTFEPFEKQFNCPAGFIELCDKQIREFEVVGEKNEAFFCFRIDEDDPAQLLGILFPGGAAQYDDLITTNRAVARYGIGVTNGKTEVRFCAGDEERFGLLDTIQPLVGNVAPIHDIKGAGLKDDGIEPVDVMHFPIGNMDHCWHGPAQIQLGMDFDRSLLGAEVRPRIQSEAKINRRGIDRVHGALDLIEVERRVGIKLPRSPNEQHGEVLIDAPVPGGVRVGERAAGDCSSESKVIELVCSRPQAILKVTEALREGQLREGEPQQLIPTGQLGGLIVTSILINYTVKIALRKKVDDLAEDIASCIHPASVTRGNWGQNDAFVTRLLTVA